MARWKRGRASQGVRQAVAYAFSGACDASLTAKTADGVLAAAGYADAVMTRYIVENESICEDLLTRVQLADWVDGRDPFTGEVRGQALESPSSDLILDATINAPKTYSLAALLDPEIRVAYEDLQDRLRDRIMKLWQQELNARRGHAGAIREDLARIEVVELKHERSRSLDPHKHRHLWLNVRVQGQDGRWSNLDTRVALRFQNVINAEGELAARTDPAWITALHAKGYTLGSDGEIAQLKHLVRPASKRSAQIEANMAVRESWWRQQHPGQEPSFDVLMQIHRWAWAAGRPGKPTQLDEEDWAAVARAELEALDPEVGIRRAPVSLTPVAVGELDLGLLAAKAIVDADRRSTGCGGRFSMMDVRAGALRAIGAAGVVAGRADFDETVAAVIAQAVGTHTVTLLSEPGIPAHVKRLMATGTAVLKATLARRIQRLAAPGTALAPEEAARVARVVEPERVLDEGQLHAGAAISGTARTVAVTGEAGTGKTTMLKVAAVALRRQGRQLIVVAPTKKAATVAGREIGAGSSSLHQLLHDHGWRWHTAESGATRWTRLEPGQTDPATGTAYPGPRTRVRPGDRIVVDEAGMLDLETAAALTDLVERTGAHLALVGDDRQALPVGHSGAMALFTRYAAQTAELTSIHRYSDPAWAEVTTRLRNPDSETAAHQVAAELIRTGHVTIVASEQDARQVMADAWQDATRHGQTIALVTATHEEAQEVGETIQARRITSGQLDTRQATIGQNGQTIYVGDVVQTRRNDTGTGVQNRQHWVVKNITADSIVLAAAGDSSDLRRISRDYAAEHLHLGYASTVYGIQGETTDASLVGPGVDASGLYVGLTRGRERNTALVVASSDASAHRQLVETMQRQPIEETLEKNRATARAELARAAQADSNLVSGASPSSTPSASLRI